MRKRNFRKRNSIIKIRPLNEICPFCEKGTIPNYKDFGELARYITDRGKIMQRARTGLCAKHQRRLAVAIKRGRHLGVLSGVTALQ